MSPENYNNLGKISKEQAVEIYNSKVWENWDDEQIVRFQLFQSRLCVDFSRFHSAMEAVLDRAVYTHEFANSQALKEEYLGSRKAPTMDEIIAMIPTEKLVVLKLE